MSFLTTLAKKLKGHDCGLLVKRTGTEITISGASIGFADAKIDIGRFSNKLLELVHATEVAVAIDNSQYLICKEASSLENDDQTKTDYKKIRLQLILAFYQLQGLLGTLKEQPTEELKVELSNWVKFMNELNKEAILYLQPGPKFSRKGGKSTNAKKKRIMKYQKIDENELQSAIAEM